MSSEREELLGELGEIFALSVEDVLDRQINRKHTNAAEYRLPADKRAELKARLEKDMGFVKAFVEEGAYIPALEIVKDLIAMCKSGVYRLEGHSSSGEIDGLAQILPAIEMCLRSLRELQVAEQSR